MIHGMRALTSSNPSHRVGADNGGYLYLAVSSGCWPGKIWATEVDLRLLLAQKVSTSSYFVCPMPVMHRGQALLCGGGSPCPSRSDSPNRSNMGFNESNTRTDRLG